MAKRASHVLRDAVAVLAAGFSLLVPARAQPATKEAPRIVVLYDAFGKTGEMKQTGDMRRSLNTQESESCSTPETIPLPSPATQRRATLTCRNLISWSCLIATAIIWEVWHTF